MTARLLTITVLAVGALTTAACGSSDPKGNANANTDHQQLLAFSQCMRSHGVPNFPDPGANGTLRITPSSGVNKTPAFRAANQACQRLLPGGGISHPSPSNQRRMLALAECMRRHGVTSFPDPTIFHGGVPSGRSLVINGYEFNLGPGLDPQSPTFQQAMSACGGPGGPGRR